MKGWQKIDYLGNRYKVELSDSDNSKRILASKLTGYSHDTLSKVLESEHIYLSLLECHLKIKSLIIRLLNLTSGSQIRKPISEVVKLPSQKSRDTASGDTCVT